MTWKYTGQIDPDGRREYVPGIPARDITDDEAKERGWLDTLKVSPVYKHEPDKPEKAEKEVKNDG